MESNAKTIFCKYLFKNKKTKLKIHKNKKKKLKNNKNHKNIFF